MSSKFPRSREVEEVRSAILAISSGKKKVVNEKAILELLYAKLDKIEGFEQKREEDRDFDDGLVTY